MKILINLVFGVLEKEGRMTSWKIIQETSNRVLYCLE